MSSRWADWAEHIVENADRIGIHLNGRAPDQIVDDVTAIDAIERSLERISEAVYRFHRAGVDLASLEPGINWVDVRTFGNRLRHEYDSVEVDLISTIVRNNLTQMRAAALRLRDRFLAEA